MKSGPGCLLKVARVSLKVTKKKSLIAFITSKRAKKKKKKDINGAFMVSAIGISSLLSHRPMAHSWHHLEAWQHVICEITPTSGCRLTRSNAGRDARIFKTKSKEMPKHLHCCRRRQAGLQHGGRLRFGLLHTRCYR